MQQRDARKNYIGLVSDTTEDKHLAHSAARSRPRVMSYLVGRLAAVLKRPRPRLDARSSPGKDSVKSGRIG
ncbi:hypothetical protein B5V03_09215 [Bradyrhizobium betae]|uniref:Uncharacterized protein n=1 Tax=Bradyrhizobium betae TaxID=244734 RepID=A0A4Q1VDK6_9BRAD|nr:hypothetical protein B5V03_09215 [Bradyrhizobium betae]